MTREDAIKILKEDGCGYCTWQSVNPYECENKECEMKKALDMAIQALSQEPCTNAVSRQAVIELAYDMSEIDGEHFTEPQMVVDVEEIQKLPSVTQKSETVTEFADRCRECGKMRFIDDIKSDLISEANEHMDVEGDYDDGVRFGLMLAEQIVCMHLGKAQKSGKWISEKVDGEDWKGCKRQYYQPISCSKCHSPNIYKTNYCPNCGADMREKAVEE